MTVLTIATDVITFFRDVAGTAEDVCNLLFWRSVDALKLTGVLEFWSSDTAELLFCGMGRLLECEDERVKTKLVSAEISLCGICDEVLE